MIKTILSQTQQESVLCYMLTTVAGVMLVIVAYMI